MADVFHATSRPRETYSVIIEHSILWECALGIAAVTNDRLLDTLDVPKNYWQERRSSFTNELNKELDYVEEHNTWKALLQLLHHTKSQSLDAFMMDVANIDDEAFTYICIPFVGERNQSLRSQAAKGDVDAVEALQQITDNNPFFPRYIQFICQTDVAKLKQHLGRVMSLWYEEVIREQSEWLPDVLAYDGEKKQERASQLESQALVQWATGGIDYAPEPSVHTVLLIPQYVYRPWNIEADLEGTKVFYYPVANDSIAPSDPYLPSTTLLQKQKALADETRLRLVKLLSEGDKSLQELTELVGAGKTTVHHHLKLLRAAKMVTVSGNMYALKANIADILHTELVDFLKR